jgi:hypothetical protein
LTDYGLKVNPKKCKFHREEVDFLGFIIGRNGIRIDLAKAKSINEWPALTNIKEV